MPPSELPNLLLLSQSEVPYGPLLHQMYSSISSLRFGTKIRGSAIDEIWIWGLRSLKSRVFRSRREEGEILVRV